MSETISNNVASNSNTEEQTTNEINPFKHRIKLEWYDKLQVLIMSISIAPLRVLLMFLLVLIMNFLAFARPASTIILGKETTDRIIIPFACFCGRSWFFVAGFFWIKVIGKQSLPSEAPILVFAPHSTFIDAIAFAATGLPSALSRIENAQIPFIGRCLDLTDPLYVSREDKKDRSACLRTMKERAVRIQSSPFASCYARQLGIFPEGTCGNRTALLQFKQGAFAPGLPVQPILLRYSCRKDTYTWTWDGNCGMLQMWLTLCQFYNHFCVEFLPVYYPSQEEKQDSILYAKNVQQYMSGKLSIPVTDFTYHDVASKTEEKKD